MNFFNKLKSTLIFALLLLSGAAFAQVTTSAATGIVKDNKGGELIGATVMAVHLPTGSNYGTVTNADGHFILNNIRVGGPYKLTVSFIGYKTYETEIPSLKLGEVSKFNIVLAEDAMLLSEVEVVYKKNALINSQRTGASTNISNATLNALPTLNRSLEDFTRLNPNVRGGGGQNALSFAGMDNRFNNLTIDGSVFNNSFGLQALPGSQTNSTPISLDAVEQLQINLAPYDVRQGGFAGAGINAVTRSGTNEFSGSAFFNNRSNNLVGKKDYFGNTTAASTNSFGVNQAGFRLGGPIIKNKLFFFINGELENRTSPGTNFFAEKTDGSNKGQASTTRVKEQDLVDVANILKTKYGYDPGNWEGYDLVTKSTKGLARIDYNINQKHKMSVRFNALKSQSDVPMSSSGGFTGRNGNAFGMNYQTSNYTIHNDIYSGIAELNSIFGSKISNKLIVGYTANRDYREELTPKSFPTVDILEGGRNYIAFGSEPFTPNNTLNTDTYQAIDQMTYSLGKHTIGVGASFERFKFENIFTPTVNGQFVFNSLADFKKAVNGDSIMYNRYALTYSVKPDRSPWASVVTVNQIGAYLQDEWDVTDNFRLTLGVRVDVPLFDALDKSVYFNPQIDTTGNASKGFQIPTVSNGVYGGEKVKLSTYDLPKANANFSPRIGFNWNPLEDKSLQIRGGIGLFSGRPAFVWLANQAGNNGMLSGQINDISNTSNPDKTKWVVINNKKYPFTDNVDKYEPTTVTRPAKSYNIAATDPDFKFPQVLRGSIAFDYKLPFGLVATAEGMYSKTLNDMLYYQANLKAPSRNFAGADTRPRYDNTRYVSYVTDATVLSNTGKSFGYFATFKLEKAPSKGLGGFAAYTFGNSRDMMSAGSIAFSSWRDVSSVNGNNYLDLAYSNNDQRHRVIGAVTYRIEYPFVQNKFLGATQISLLGESYNQGRYSFTFSGDMNGDGIAGNDLIYVPSDKSKMNFEEFKGAKADKTPITFTVDDQKNAFEAFINQDKYLKGRRGKYAERNGGVFDFVTRFDFNIVQEFMPVIGGKTHTIQLRADIFNVGNLLSKTMGVGYRMNTSAPLVYSKVDANGTPIYRMATIKDAAGNDTINFSSFTRTTNLQDLWQAQLGIRYLF
ncbi:MAG: TonB-dependent receptor [Saprospiraceae bacterium]